MHNSFDIDKKQLNKRRLKYRKKPPLFYLVLALKTSPIWLLPIALFLLHNGLFIAGGIALTIPVAFTLFVAVTSIKEGLDNLKVKVKTKYVFDDNLEHQMSIAIQNKKSAQAKLPYFAVTTVINSATSLFFLFDLAMVTPALVFAVPAAIALVLTMVFVFKYCKAKKIYCKAKKISTNNRTRE